MVLSSTKIIGPLSEVQLPLIDTRFELLLTAANTEIDAAKVKNIFIIGLPWPIKDYRQDRNYFRINCSNESSCKHIFVIHKVFAIAKANYPK